MGRFCTAMLLNRLSKSSAELLLRSFSTGRPVLQVASHSAAADEHEELRKAPTQMKTLLDIGSRSIFDKDQDIFRESVRKFLNDEVKPRQEEFEKNGQPTREMWQAFGKQGLLGVHIPAEIGGIGGTILDEMIVMDRWATTFVPALIL